MKELIEFDVFDAGMNTKADPLNLLPGQSYDMNNIVFGDYGSIKTRGGISTHNSVQMATHAVLGLASYQPSTMSAQLMAVCNGTLYVMTGASTTPIAVSGATSIWGQSQQVEMDQMNEILFLFGGGGQPYKFNGNNFVRAGIYAPTQVLTAACDAAGAITGEYSYVYWGVNSYAAEGDYITTPSPVKTIASGQIRVNNIPTAPASSGINTWKIGRNTAGASGIYWLVTSVTNGVTSFTDSVSDDDLDVLAPVDQGYMRAFRCTCVYGGRLWGAIGDYLWYSNVDQPEEFPSTNFIRVGKGTGISISSIVPFMGMIVISLSGWNPSPPPNGSVSYSEKTQLCVLRIGDSIGFNDPENWYLNIIADDVGSESHRACIPIAGYLWLTNRSGVSLFNGSGIESGFQDTASGGIMTPKISDPIGTLFEFDEPSDIRIACAIQWKNRIYLSVPSDRYPGIPHANTDPANNKTLIYDYTRVGKADPRNGAWSKIENIGASKFVIHEGNLYGANSDSDVGLSQFAGGYIFRWDDGTNHDPGSSTSINPSYSMAPIRGKPAHVYNDKDFRYVNIWASGIGTLTVTFVIDGLTYASGTLIHTEAITLTTAGTKTKITLPHGATGKHVWIKFTAAAITTNVDMSISKVQVFYNLRGLRNA